MKHINVGRYEFSYVCALDFVRNVNGEIQEYMPQERYYKAASTPLNRYGSGPFVKFKIPRSIQRCGVYVLLLDSEVKYIGEAANLSDRYNMGYGNISPKNCFKGGQETNCRLNNLIYLQAIDDRVISLYLGLT